MYLDDEHHILRYARRKDLVINDFGHPVEFTPQAFEMKERDKGKLSSNWVEFFEEDTFVKKRDATIKSFRKVFDVGSESAFGLARVGKLINVCAGKDYVKVKVDHDSNNKTNPSHARILRLPFNDSEIMASLAKEVFDVVISNSDVND